ncbi:MAG: hypothetical protein RL148_648 [Planctomycetota bacterium]|jgi:hypothetical protein
MSPFDAGDDEVELAVAAVWRAARVSCPHPDLLRSHHAGALADGAAEFVRFHLEESQCPFCRAVVDACAAEDEAARRATAEGLRDRLMRSTLAAVRSSRR